MARPRTFEEYLASLVPPSVTGVNRRTLLAGGVSLSALALAGCGGDGDSASTTTSQRPQASATGGTASMTRREIAGLLPHRAVVSTSAA